MECLFNEVGDRPSPALRGSAADNEKVTKIRDLAHIQDHDVFSFSIFRELSR
jgi:hypothetical protein